MQKTFSSLQEKLQGLSAVCFDLIRKAAFRYYRKWVQDDDRSVQNLGQNWVKNSGKAALLSVEDVQSEMYEFLVLSMAGKDDTEHAAKLLGSVWSLSSGFNDWMRERERRKGGRAARSDSSMKGISSLPRVYDPVKAYRRRINDVLGKKGRRVHLAESPGTLWFSYAGKDIPRLSESEYVSRIGDMLRGYVPSLGEREFCVGEEDIQNGTGKAGRRKGPSAEELDDLCRGMFEHVAGYLGRSHMLTVDMVMDMLRRKLTFFSEPVAVSLDMAADDVRDGGRIDALVSGRMAEEKGTMRLTRFGRRRIEKFAGSMTPVERRLLMSLLSEGLHGERRTLRSWTPSRLNHDQKKFTGHLREHFSDAELWDFVQMSDGGMPDMSDAGVRNICRHMIITYLGWCCETQV